MKKKKEDETIETFEDREDSKEMVTATVIYRGPDGGFDTHRFDVPKSLLTLENRVRHLDTFQTTLLNNNVDLYRKFLVYSK